jgi:hypothetical protein
VKNLISFGVQKEREVVILVTPNIMKKVKNASQAMSIAPLSKIKAQTTKSTLTQTTQQMTIGVNITNG